MENTPKEDIIKGNAFIIEENWGRNLIGSLTPPLNVDQYRVRTLPEVPPTAKQDGGVLSRCN